MLDCMDQNKKSEEYERINSFPFSKSRNNWADPGFRDWLFGHDVVKEAEELRENKKDNSAQ